MTRSKLLLAPVALATAAALTAGAAPPPRTAPREPLLLIWWHTRPAVLKPDGTGIEKFPPLSDHKNPWIGYARLSPDGRRIVATTNVEDVDGKARYGLFVRDLRAEGSGDRLGTNADSWRSLSWTPDAAAVITTELTPPAAGARNPPSNGVWVATRTNLKTRRQTPLLGPAPTEVHLNDLSADGKTFLATRWGEKKTEVGLVPADKPAEFTPVTDGSERIRGLRLSPDGRRALVDRMSRGMNRTRYDLLVVDLPTKRLTPVAYLGNVSIAPHPPATWSPDGTRIAFVQIELDDGWDYQLTVCNDDGSDAKVILHTKDQITSVDWR